MQARECVNMFSPSIWTILYFAATALRVNAEPKCYSRFDYEEKLLKKLVKIEYQIEILNSEKAERKKELEAVKEDFREKGDREIRKQKNVTALRAESFNLEKTERMKSFEDERKEFREKSVKEIQKQKGITSALLEKGTDLEAEMEEHRQILALERQKQENLTALLYENLTLEKTKRRRSFEAEMEEFRKKNSEEIQKQRNLSAILQVNDTLLTFFRAPVVVFTVTSPGKGSTADAITFTNEIINEGGGFDIATGIFTCPVSGMYYFNLHLVKASDSSVDQVSCYIKKNRLNTVRVHLEPNNRGYSNSGVYGASNSVYLTLSIGDVVNIAGCYDPYRYRGASGTLESWSSFSGSLVRPALLMPKENGGG